MTTLNPATRLSSPELAVTRAGQPLRVRLPAGGWHEGPGQAGAGDDVPTAGTRKPGPSPARANGTPVRLGSHHVEVAGIEPASFGTSPGLLRAQPASLFSAPAVLQASRRRAQSLLDVPLGPATGLSGGSSLLMPDTGPEALPG